MAEPVHIDSMTRKEIKRHYWLNTAKEIPNGKNLRNFFRTWNMNRKWIPDHLRMPDGSHCYCWGRISA